MIISFMFISCNTQPQEPRYIVLGGGETPMFLDTKTNDVYMVVRGVPLTIYKTNLTKAKP